MVNFVLLVTVLFILNLQLASSTKYDAKFCAKRYNCVMSLKSDQSAYQSELAGVISGLTILDILVCHYNIIKGAIVIAVDRKYNMDENREEWLLSIDQTFSTTYRSSMLGSSYHYCNFNLDKSKATKLNTFHKTS